MPKVSSPENTSVVSTTEDDVEFEAVAGTTLCNIIETHGLTNIDLLELDCEGAKYEILLEAPGDILRKIHRIRIELHFSGKHSRANVLGWLQDLGFSCVRNTGMIYWFEQIDR